MSIFEVGVEVEVGIEDSRIESGYRIRQNRIKLMVDGFQGGLKLLEMSKEVECREFDRDGNDSDSERIIT
jgi:hypothetical protein